MDIWSAIKIIGCFMIILASLLVILFYRVQDEKKCYSGYAFSNNNKYQYLSQYKAYIENGSQIYQTNRIYLYVTNDAIILQKESIKKGFYNIVFDINNILSIIISKEEILFGFQYKLIIYHNEKDINSPCEVAIKSYIDENVLTMIEDLSI